MPKIEKTSEQVENNLVRRLGEHFPEELDRIKSEVRDALDKALAVDQSEDQGVRLYGEVVKNLPLDLRFEACKRDLLSKSDDSGLLTNILDVEDRNSLKDQFREFIEANEDVPANTEAMDSLCLLLDYYDTDFVIATLKRKSFKDQLDRVREKGQLFYAQALHLFIKVMPYLSIDETATFFVPEHILAGIKANLHDPDTNRDYLELVMAYAKTFSGDERAIKVKKQVKEMLKPEHRVYYEYFERTDSEELGRELMRFFEVSLPRSARNVEDFVKTGMGKAVLNFVKYDQAKKRLLKGSEALRAMKDPQKLITINSPKQARTLYEMICSKLPSKFEAFHRTISTYLKRKVLKLEEDDFDFYADEIIDGVQQFVQNSSLKNDSEVLAELEKCKFGMRYSQRSFEDVKAGEKTGDCTSVGSVNFENSLSWHVNPAYQMINLRKGNRFLGRFNITLGIWKSDNIILVDAVEFNPQVGGEANSKGPYYEDGQKALKETIAFLYELARSEGRRLIVYATSNSSDVDEEIKKYSEVRVFNEEEKANDITRVSLGINNPSLEVERVLRTSGYRGDVKLWYQSIENAYSPEKKLSAAATTKDKITEKLERDIFNPMQILNAELAEALRLRNFNAAAKILLNSCSDKFQKVLGFEPDEDFVERKLLQAYPEAQTLAGASNIQYFSVAVDPFIEVIGLKEAA